MKRSISLTILTLFGFLYLAKPAHAIVFLPALVLIPVAKIVALAIGGFTLPTIGGGILWNKLFGGSVWKTLTIVLLLLILIAGVLALFLHLENPDRPLF